MEGLTELLLGAPDPRAHESRGQFEVTGSLPYLIDPLGCLLHNDVLQVSVRAGGASARQLGTVAYAITRGVDLLTTGAIQLSDADWTLKGPEWVGTAAVPAVTGTAATLLLRVGTRTLARHRLGNFEGNPTNPRVQALASADPDLALLQRALQTYPATSSNSKDSKAFERAVARLFAILGFQVLGLGPEGEMSDAVDVIAFDPQGTSVLALECIAEAIDSGGKLGKLHYRARKLQDLLPERDVLSVVMTAGQRALLAAAELEQAGHDRTIVLGAEQSQELLTMASEGCSVRDILAYLSQMIPPRPQRGGMYHPSLGGLNRLL
jgi:hypothetical protein